MAAEDYFPHHLHSDDVPWNMPLPPTYDQRYNGTGVSEPRNHGKPWQDPQDGQLRAKVRRGMTLQQIAEHMGRTPYAIECRMKYLGLEFSNPNALAVSQQPQSKGLNVKLVHLLTLLQEGYTTVHVVFHKSDAKSYAYKASTDMKLQVGDRVVVPATDDMRVGVIAKVDDEPQIDFNQPYALKWVVQKVDLTEYERQQVAEAAALHELTKAQQKKLQEQAIQMLFGSDSKLEEIKSLLNTKQLPQG